MTPLSELAGEGYGWCVMRVDRAWLFGMALVAAVAILASGRVDARDSNASVTQLVQPRPEREGTSAPVRLPAAAAALAQGPAQAEAVRQLEAQGFRDISGLMRRGDNYIAQATDFYGMRVRIVMNARTGEIVGYSEIVPKKK